MKQGEQASVIKPVNKCIDVSDINARVICSEAQREGAYDKAVRRFSDVCNVRVLDAVRG